MTASLLFEPVLKLSFQELFVVLHELHAADATEKITSLAWSPDDTMLLLGVECAVKIYDVQSGHCTLNVIKHDFCAVGGVTWLPNSSGFFSGGLDAKVLCWVSTKLLNQVISRY